MVVPPNHPFLKGFPSKNNPYWGSTIPFLVRNPELNLHLQLLHSGKLYNQAMENEPFEDVFPIENRGYSSQLC